MPFGTITLNNGQEIPAIAFGTGSVWKQPTDSDPGPTPYIVQAINAGFVHIDTAQAYETESHVGEALRQAGEKSRGVWVTTKYAVRFGRTPREGLLQSLEYLGLPSVDMYLIHSPRWLPDGLRATWEAFEEVLKEGLTRGIGVSNFAVSDLQELMKYAKITPAVNQISFNPYVLAETEPTLAFCKKHRILAEAFSPLAPITRFPGGPVDVPVLRAAERRGVTPAHILLAWVRAKGCAIVTTTSKQERMREYLEAGDIRSLTQEEIDAIDEAGRQGPPLGKAHTMWED